MNLDEAVSVASELGLRHRVRVMKTGSGPDDFDVVVITSPGEPGGVAKTIEKRLGRLESILQERARHDPSKAANLTKIKDVVRAYLRKIAKFSERPDMDTRDRIELDEISRKLESVSNVLSSIIDREMAGGIPGDPSGFTASLDLYHRVAVLASQLGERLKASQPQKKTLGGKVVPQFRSAKKRKKS